MSRDGDRDQARDGVHDTRTGPGPARARPASAPPASPTPGSARPAPSLRRSGRGGPGPGCSSSADTSSWTGSGPGRACAMRAQRDAVHPASHRASPARRNPPRLDSCEPASHNASRGDITNSTPPGGRGSGDADADVAVAVGRLPPGRRHADGRRPGSRTASSASGAGRAGASARRAQWWAPRWVQWSRRNGGCRGGRRGPGRFPAPARRGFLGPPRLVGRWARSALLAPQVPRAARASPDTE